MEIRKKPASDIPGSAKSSLLIGTIRPMKLNAGLGKYYKYLP